MTTTKTWILVADGFRGRVYEDAGNGTGLRPALDHDLYGGDGDDADKRPSRRTFERSGLAKKVMGLGASVGSGVSDSFAKSVARFLDRSMQNHMFDRLVIVAPPQVLGTLRGALPSSVRNCVSSEVGKDLTNYSCFELPKFLGPSLAH